MGDFFGDLGKKLTDTAEAVGRKTEEVVEIQKLRNKIRVMENNNTRDFTDLGKIIYDRFQVEEPVVREDYVVVAENIFSREQKINELKQEIAKKKGYDLCKECNTEVQENMNFCPVCGEEVVRDEEDVVDVEIVEEEPEVASETAEEVTEEKTEESAEQTESAE